MEKITFKEIRQSIIDLCKQNHACKPEFTKLVSAETEAEFWKVILNNGNWCYTNNIFNIDLLNSYGQYKLSEFGLFWTDKYTTNINSFVMGNSSVVACGNSSVVARDNSSVVAWDNSYVRINKYSSNVSSNIKINNSSVLTSHKENKIYIKKGAFEIIYLD